MWRSERLSDTLEGVVGLAIIDPDFQTELLENPVAAVRRHNVALTPAELELLAAQPLGARDLATLSLGLLREWSAQPEAPAASNVISMPEWSARQSRSRRRHRRGIFDEPALDAGTTVV